MQASSLIYLLKNLNKAEFRRLHKFLQSPFFNGNSQIIDFYRYLKRYYPAFKSSNLSKQNVFQVLYPNLAYSDTKMRLLISDFKLLVEEYLVQLQLKKESINHQKLWVDALNERNMEKHYYPEEKKLEKKLVANQLHDAHKYLTLHQLNHTLLHDISKRNTASNKAFLLQANENLDLFYFTRKLQYIASMATKNRLYQSKSKLPFSEPVLHAINQPAYTTFPLFQILKVLIEFIEQGYSDTIYFQLKAKIQQEFDTFAPDLKLTILQLLFNQCTYLYKSGNIDFLKEQFAWYKFGFDKKVLVEQVQLTDITYKNTIVLGCHFQHLNWVKTFIENYTDYLLPEERAVAKAIGLAYYHFNSGNYEEVIQQLQHLDLGKKHTLNGRSLLLQSYIELYFLQPANTLYIFHYATAFKRYLRRSKNGAVTKLAFTNYINLSIKILEYHESNKWGFEALAQELNSGKPFVSKPWLLQLLRK